MNNSFDIHAVANKTEKASVFVTDVTGRKVFTSSFELNGGQSNFLSIPALSFTSGVYLIKIEGGINSTLKAVKP
jgi:hypothetical protein